MTSQRGGHGPGSQPDPRGSRIFALLLRTLPRGFRERYGAELTETHGRRMETARSARGLVRLRTVAHEVAGLALLTLRLRFDRSTRTPSSLSRARPSMIDGLKQDLRTTLRSLRRNPAFAATVVGVLALGIGAVTAIFSAVNAYFFRPLPFLDEERVVALYETNPEFGWVDATAAPANAMDWRDQVDAFEDVALYSDFVDQTTYVQDGEPRLLNVTNVSGNFFAVLGVPPLLGRPLQWEDTWAASGDVVVLTHQVWQDVFGADTALVGATVPLSGRPFRVAAVMPPGFRFPSDETQIWGMMGWDPAAREQVWFRRAHFVRPLARLAPGVTAAQADAQLQVVVERLARDYPATNRVMGAGLAPARAFFVRQVRTPLLVLSAAVLLLLTLACVNVANLMLVRAQERSREVAVRVALGAGRARVARQVLTESGLLALLGGTLGLALGWMGIQALARAHPLGIAGATGLALDHRVVLATLGVALTAGLAFGVGPALRAGGASPGHALKDGGRGTSRGRHALRTTRLMVGTEVALALLLVLGGGLVLRSFLRLRAVDPGFQVDGVLAVELSLPNARYPERDQVLAFWDRLQTLLEARPGIERAGGVGQLPLDGTSWSSQAKAEGWPAERIAFEILHRRADRGYFEALGIPLVRGRLFEASDGPDAPPVIVINEQFAREHFPGEDPIGQRIAYDREPDSSSVWYEIVGIVGDQSQVSPGQPVRAEAFENRDQDWARDLRIVLRTEGDPLSVVPSVRSVLAELDPLIPLGEVRSLRQVWRTSIADEERVLTLLGIFAVVALLLATVGVYGVTAQAARARTHEIGVRMALGASPRDILRMMIGQGLTVVVVGMALGLGVALVAGRGLRSLLFEITPTDPLTIGGVSLLLLAAAFLACWLPARRSTRVDPRASLQAE
ncbi:MAG: ABC transporter permease [Gemmatimonadota bacterium]